MISKEELDELDKNIKKAIREKELFELVEHNCPEDFMFSQNAVDALCGEEEPSEEEDLLANETRDKITALLSTQDELKAEDANDILKRVQPISKHEITEQEAVGHGIELGETKETILSLEYQLRKARVFLELHGYTVQKEPIINKEQKAVDFLKAKGYDFFTNHIVYIPSILGIEDAIDRKRMFPSSVTATTNQKNPFRYWSDGTEHEIDKTPNGISDGY